jgi:hypothetical protein
MIPSRSFHVPRKIRVSMPVLVLFVSAWLRPEPSFGTASTQIWNPSTDIQKAGTVHLGIDNFFSIVKNSTKPYQINPDAGVTVGIWKYLEAGIDMIQPSPDPFYLNFKLGLPESGGLPALAVGGCNFGTKKDITNYNMLYGAAAKTLPAIGRLTVGYYQGMNENLFLDENEKADKRGFIATWDKALTEKIWACIDYASGKNWYGSLSVGASYAFGSGVSLIIGYVVFNNDRIIPNNTVTTQLDINL